MNQGKAAALWAALIALAGAGRAVVGQVTELNLPVETGEPAPPEPAADSAEQRHQKRMDAAAMEQMRQRCLELRQRRDELNPEETRMAQRCREMRQYRQRMREQRQGAAGRSGQPRAMDPDSTEIRSSSGTWRAPRLRPSPFSQPEQRGVRQRRGRRFSGGSRP